jgi:hypothetical protein
MIVILPCRITHSRLADVRVPGRREVIALDRQSATRPPRMAVQWLCHQREQFRRHDKLVKD